MWKFMQWQQRAKHLESVTSPLAMMSSSQPPARLALAELLDLMLAGTATDDADSPSFMDVVEGPLSKNWQLWTKSLSFS